MTEPLDDARGELLALADELHHYCDKLCLLQHETFIKAIAALRAAPARYDAESAGPTAEDIRACAWSTLIGWQHELGDSIDFICDQIARKATMPAVSSTHRETPQ